MRDLHRVVDSSCEMRTQEALSGSCGFTWQAPEMGPNQQVLLS